jgi:hypothetical protein
MLESLSSALAGISLAQFALIAGLALFASIVGGVSGYGTGALMPLVLVPIFGPEPVVPMLALSALVNNASRVGVYRHLVDWRRTLVVLSAALPLCLLGAWGYTNSPAVALASDRHMMMLSVPLRRRSATRLRALRPRPHDQLGRLGRRCGRHHRRWRDAAVDADGGRPAGRGGSRPMQDLDRHGVAKVSVFACRVARVRELAIASLMGAMAIPGALMRGQWSTACRSRCTPRS